MIKPIIGGGFPVLHKLARGTLLAAGNAAVGASARMSHPPRMRRGLLLIHLRRHRVGGVVVVMVIGGGESHDVDEWFV